MTGVQSNGALYAEVADRLVSLIERGTLRPGDRLPSLRGTSTTERVSLTTSLHAYALLEMRGYVEARPQSGFYVRPHASRDAPEPGVAPSSRNAARVDAGAGVARVLQSAHDRRLVPFGAACPSPALLPTRKLARLVSSVARLRGAGRSPRTMSSSRAGRPKPWRWR
jgi:DNA-binding transcriptional MocR family regulator